MKKSLVLKFDLGLSQCMIVYFFFIFAFAGSTDNVSLTGEVAVTCLKKAISYFHDQSDYLKKIAAMTFPLLLVMPQVASDFRFNILFFIESFSIIFCAFFVHCCIHICLFLVIITWPTYLSDCRHRAWI